MKEYIQTKCFWFQKGNPEVTIDDGGKKIHFEETISGCRYNEYCGGIKPCKGICPQFVTYDKSTIAMMHKASKSRNDFADYWDAMIW